MATAATRSPASAGNRHTDSPENTGREYQSPPQPATEALTFDKDDESDRELLREDPYAEYIDFPQECRMKDETQAELICY